MVSRGVLIFRENNPFATLAAVPAAVVKFYVFFIRRSCMVHWSPLEQVNKNLTPERRPSDFIRIASNGIVAWELIARSRLRLPLCGAFCNQDLVLFAFLSAYPGHCWKQEIVFVNTESCLQTRFVVSADGAEHTSTLW